MHNEIDFKGEIKNIIDTIDDKNVLKFIYKYIKKVKER